MSDMFDRTITITPAFDRRDPDPTKNYGIHGCELRCVLKGPRGAVQFVLFTNWQLPHVTQEQMTGSLDTLDIRCRFLPLPADLGYHSAVPRYEGQTVCDNSCQYLDGAPCYYGGSGLAAERVYERLLEGGSDAVWQELVDYYVETLGSRTDTEAT